ncbi:MULTISPECIES: signal peptidase II [unclassified Planococcus (in: firmicutes)]|uniref:signal peptidase II n=1 Tax=unclassified Planococcus (in: firmicutes) TaxID=2662419 RepID=UPI001F3AB8BA|nr:MULTISPECIES: signal peptidase II [unclassified Planococcus (in: firmicutes)]UJF25814.1 signal peptidase II [Planococcus sp. 107-1]GKW44945.1 lipoprotein signal peptidase [Planococcus sp. NCCP-2050]
MFIYYGIALLIVAADQWTKWLVLKHMELGERIPVIEPYLAWLSHRNRGAAWGMLEGKMWLFAIITIAVIIGILYYFHKHAKGQPLFQLSLMIILGGAVGNFIDRMLRGEVVDFVDVLIPIINYDFPIFNVADAALTVGVVLMIIFVIYDEKQEKKKVS